MSVTTMDGDQSNEGTPTSPNAGGSQGNGVSGGSGAGQAQTDFEALTKRLAEAEKQLRSLQGDKDRGVAQTKKDVDELKRKFAEVEGLKKRGLSEDDAFEEFELREMIRSLKNQTSNPAAAQSALAGNENGLAVDKAKTLQEYGLSENDADVASELAGKTFSNPVELENAVLKLAYKRANKPQPDASASLAAQGSPVSQKSDTGSLISKLNELQKFPTKNKEQIKAIAKQLDERGWE